jgi:hypothetical protein
VAGELILNSFIRPLVFAALFSFLLSLLEEFGVLRSATDWVCDRLRLMIFLDLLRSSRDMTPICRAIS